jgi:hypothetical protein
MHYLPVLVFFGMIKFSLICAFGGPRKVWDFAKDCMTVGEDHWTWTTCSGEWFEDAEIEAIEEGELVLRHRYGIVRLAIDRLSEQSRHLLLQTEKWAEYISSVPTAGKITPFRLEHAECEAA